jgi:PAS domain S-box-containing protein
VAHTHEVLDATGDALRTLVDAETGQRGFLITGNEAFLQPYDDALTRLDGQLGRLKQLTGDNETQQDRVRKLQELAAVRLVLLREGIDLRRKDERQAKELVASQKGKAQMDAARDVVTEMEQAEHELLRERERRSATSYAVAVTSGLLTAVLGLAGFGAFLWLLNRSLIAGREAAAAVHQQREWFRTTLASVGDAVLTTDVAGRVTFLNPVAERLTGWNREEALGQPLGAIFRIVNEQTRRPVEDPATRALREGTVVGLANHTLLIGRDGTERPVDDSAAPIRDEAGAVAGVVLVFRDVTERRRLERLQGDLQGQLEQQVQERTRDLRQTEERFRLLVENATEYAIFLLDTTGRIVSWNPGAERINGYRAEEIIGEHFSRFYPAADVAAGKPAWELEVAVAKGKYGEEGWRVRKDGNLFWASVLITALRDETGLLRGFSKITRDMTERKQAEENARHLAEEQAARREAEAAAKVIREQREQLRVTLESIGRAERVAQFLADASAELAALVDYESTLQKVARLAVPFFADWCAVDMAGPDGALRRVAVAHVDPAKVQLAHDLHRRFPYDPADPHGTPHVLRTGQPELVPEITDAMLAQSVADEERLRALLALGLRSYVGVPIQIRGQGVGVLTFIAAESGRRYGPADLTLARDLAQRVAVAVENARLYSELKEADRKKNEFLAMLAHAPWPLSATRCRSCGCRAWTPPPPGGPSSCWSGRSATWSAWSMTSSTCPASCRARSICARSRSRSPRWSPARWRPPSRPSTPRGTP